MVKITFLIVEYAETFTVSAPLDHVVDIIKANLRAGEIGESVVVTDIEEEEESED